MITSAPGITSTVGLQRGRSPRAAARVAGEGRQHSHGYSAGETVRFEDAPLLDDCGDVTYHSTRTSTWAQTSTPVPSTVPDCAVPNCATPTPDRGLAAGLLTPIPSSTRRPRSSRPPPEWSPPYRPPELPMAFWRCSLIATITGLTGSGARLRERRASVPGPRSRSGREAG